MNRFRKKLISLLLIVTVVCGMLIGCGASNSWKYTSKHCGTKMEAYWYYDNGYVCHSCYKKYYKNK